MCLQCLEQYLEGGPERVQMPLREKYGDPYRISNVYLKKINEWLTIWTGDEQAQDKFSVFLTQRRGAITKLTFLSILNHPLNFQSMVACFLPSSRTGGAMKPVEQDCLRERDSCPWKLRKICERQGKRCKRSGLLARNPLSRG